VSLVLDVLAWAALLAGGFFTLVSAVGMQRMPDIFTRTHAASVNDTLGVGFLTLGMLLQAEDWAVAVRLVIILVVIFVSGAVAVHALARAALYNGEQPLLAGTDGVLRPIKVAALYPELGLRLSRPLISQHGEDRLALPVPAAGREGETEADADAAGRGDQEDPQWSS
jgi:multicomponent Na+:H+ antiporter subunit G